MFTGDFLIHISLVVNLIAVAGSQVDIRLAFDVDEDGELQVVAEILRVERHQHTFFLGYQHQLIVLDLLLALVLRVHAPLSVRLRMGYVVATRIGQEAVHHVAVDLDETA